MEPLFTESNSEPKNITINSPTINILIFASSQEEYIKETLSIDKRLNIKFIPLNKPENISIKNKIFSDGLINTMDMLIITGINSDIFIEKELDSIKDFVASGGSFLLILNKGTFDKNNNNTYSNTILNSFLPVIIPNEPMSTNLEVTTRSDISSYGIIIPGDHPLTKYFDIKNILIKNITKVNPRINCRTVLWVSTGKDKKVPLISFWDYGNGVASVFSSDLFNDIEANTSDKHKITKLLNEFIIWTVDRAKQHFILKRKSVDVCSQLTNELKSEIPELWNSPEWKPENRKIKKYFDWLGFFNIGEYKKSDFALDSAIKLENKEVNFHSNNIFLDYPYICLDNMRLYSAFKVGKNNSIYELRLTGWKKIYYRQTQITDYYTVIIDKNTGKELPLSRESVIEYGYLTDVPIIKVKYTIDNLSISELLFLPPEKDYLIRKYTIENTGSEEQDIEIEARLTPTIDLDPTDEIPGIDVPPDYRDNNAVYLNSVDAILIWKNIDKKFKYEVYGDIISGKREDIIIDVKDTLNLLIFGSSNSVSKEYSNAKSTTEPLLTKMRWSLGKIVPGQTATIYIYLAVTTDNPEQQVNKIRETNPENDLNDTINFWRKYTNSVTQVITPDPFLNYLYTMSVIYGKMHQKSESIIASIRFYLYTWMRDSTEIAIAYSQIGDNSLFRTHFEFAKKTQDNSGLWWAHYYTFGIPSWATLEMCELPYAGTGLWEYYVHTLDKKILEKYYPVVKKSIEYLIQQSESQSDGLIYSINMDDEFRENTPGKFFFINAHTVLSLEKASKIAQLIDKKEDAEYYAQKAKILRDKIESEYWNEQLGTYFDRKLLNNNMDYYRYAPHVCLLETVMMKGYLNPDNYRAEKSMKVQYESSFSDPNTISTHPGMRMAYWQLWHNKEDVDKAIDTIYNDLEYAFNEFGRSYLADSVDKYGQIDGPASAPEYQPLPQGWSHTYFIQVMIKLVGIEYDYETDSIVFEPKLPKDHRFSGHRRRNPNLCRHPKYPIDWSFIAAKRVHTPLGAIIDAYYSDYLKTGQIVIDMNLFKSNYLNLIFSNTVNEQQSVTIQLKNINQIKTIAIENEKKLVRDGSISFNITIPPNSRKCIHLNLYSKKDN